MPFDAIAPTAPVIPDDNPPVVRLIAALRSPLSFEWDFRHADTCALRLADDIGVYDAIEDFRLTLSPSWAEDPFSVPDRVNPIVPLYGVRARDVTPAMVADALERLLEC